MKDTCKHDGFISVVSSVGFDDINKLNSDNSEYRYKHSIIVCEKCFGIIGIKGQDNDTDTDEFCGFKFWNFSGFSHTSDVRKVP